MKITGLLENFTGEQLIINLKRVTRPAPKICIVILNIIVKED